VTPITVATNTLGTPIRVGDGPQNIAITPDGKTAYVTHYGGAVTPITLATNTVGTPVRGFSYPDAIAMTPDGRTAYVANWATGTVTPIAVATNTPGAPISVGDDPVGIAIAPDGKTAYVIRDGNTLNGDTITDNTYVTTITLATQTVGISFKAGDDLHAIAITPDGKTVYVTNSGSNSVTPITMATNTVGAVIGVGRSPWGVAIAPRGTSVYVSNLGSNSITWFIPANPHRSGTISLPIGSRPGVPVQPHGLNV